MGTVYFPGDPANQGEKLTFTVVNGAVNNWLGYISGECNPTLESVYIQGPAPIVSGVVAKGEKTTPEADKPGYYTSSSIVGTFVGNVARGTANYVAVGPCVEPQWYWSATRISS